VGSKTKEMKEKKNPYRLVLLLGMRHALVYSVTVLLEDHHNTIRNTSLFEAPPSSFNNDNFHFGEANAAKIGHPLSPKVSI